MSPDNDLQNRFVDIKNWKIFRHVVQAEKVKTLLVSYGSISFSILNLNHLFTFTQYKIIGEKSKLLIEEKKSFFLRRLVKHFSLCAIYMDGKYSSFP